MTSPLKRYSLFLFLDHSFPCTINDTTPFPWMKNNADARVEDERFGEVA